MAYPEVVIEEHAVILELEHEISKLKAEYADLARSREFWVDSYNRKDKPTEVLATLWRDHLDESDPQDDNESESQARQILWTAEDTEAKIEVEGYEEF